MDKRRNLKKKKPNKKPKNQRGKGRGGTNRSSPMIYVVGDQTMSVDIDGREIGNGGAEGIGGVLLRSGDFRYAQSRRRVKAKRGPVLPGQSEDSDQEMLDENDEAFADYLQHVLKDMDIDDDDEESSDGTVEVLDKPEFDRQVLERAVAHLTAHHEYEDTILISSSDEEDSDDGTSRFAFVPLVSLG